MRPFRVQQEAAIYKTVRPFCVQQEAAISQFSILFYQLKIPLQLIIGHQIKRICVKNRTKYERDISIKGQYYRYTNGKSMKRFQSVKQWKVDAVKDKYKGRTKQNNKNAIENA